MSVAFRRDSDEEHLEPRFELPLPAGPNLVTPRGLAQIETRIGELEQRIAGETDDAAREVANRELRYWKTRRSTAEVAPRPDGDQVAIGTLVTIRLNGDERQIAIVGHDEADPAGGRVGYAAPLARALLGAAVGEHLPFAGREDAIEILEIEVLADAGF
ncbi:MAG TPA: GreA/GreB family elongation factor [Allosphingosinicella sp.]